MEDEKDIRNDVLVSAIIALSNLGWKCSRLTPKEATVRGTGDSGPFGRAQLCKHARGISRGLGSLDW
jgi:hypothetical protein